MGINLVSIAPQYLYLTKFNRNGDNQLDQTDNAFFNGLTTP